MRRGNLIEGWNAELEEGVDAMRTSGREASNSEGVSASGLACPYLWLGKSVRLFPDAT